MANGKEEIGEYPPVMETKNLILRQFEESDLDAFKIPLADDEIVKWLAYLGGRRQSDEDSRHYLSWILEQKKIPRNERNCFDFAITDKSGKYLGHTMFTYDPKYGRDNLEIAFYLAKEVHNRNIATEANIALLEFGFNNLGLKAIHATHAMDNIPSQRVIQKLGLPCKGKKKVEMRGSGEFRESLFYEISSQEWIRSKKENPLIQTTLSSLKINDTI